MAEKQILNLLAQALQPMPYAVIGDQMILLASIVHAEVRENGEMILSMANGADIPLDKIEVSELEKLIASAINKAQSRAAIQAGKDLGLIQIPGMTH